MLRTSSLLSRPQFVLDGAYELTRSIGHGKRCVVYQAKCLPTAPIKNFLETNVALKLLLNSKGQQSIARTLREAELLNDVQSEHVIKLLDYVARTDLSYLVYELASEGDLAALVTQRRPFLSVERVLMFADQILRGLADLHSAGILHRDIKPANLLLFKNDVVKICDFSLAISLRSSTEQSELEQQLGVGTFDYLAPEQLQGSVATSQTDTYAAAVSIFELLTGHLPTIGTSLVESLSARLDQPQLRVADFRDDVSLELEAVLQKALAANPSDRYESAEQFRQALLDCCECSLLGEAGSLLPCSPPYSLSAEAESEPTVVQRSLAYRLGATLLATIVVISVMVIELMPSAVWAQKISPLKLLQDTLSTNFSSLLQEDPLLSQGLSGGVISSNGEVTQIAVLPLPHLNLVRVVVYASETFQVHASADEFRRGVMLDSDTTLQLLQSEHSIYAKVVTSAGSQDIQLQQSSTLPATQ